MKNSTNISFRNLSKVELLGVADICERIHRVEATESFLVHSHVILSEVFSNVHFFSERYSVDPFQVLEQQNDTVPDEYLPIFAEHALEHPLIRKMAFNPETELGMTHQMPGLKAFHGTTLFNEFYDRVQSQNQMWIGIRDAEELFVCVYSRDRPYTDNNLAMMHLIRPHLELAWRRWRKARKLQQRLMELEQTATLSETDAVAALQIRQAIHALPRRQREVIEHVAEGFDNQQIADAMGISIRTVHKHLENIFRAIDVHHRTELAARWHQSRVSLTVEDLARHDRNQNKYYCSGG